MPTLTLKNLPVDVHRRLEARAARHRRSLSSEAIECLRAATTATVVDPESLIAEARALRARVKARLTLRRLNDARRQGRP